MSVGHNILTKNADRTVVGHAAKALPRHDHKPLSTHICIEGLLALE